MKVHNDLTPQHDGVRIDPALILSHDRNLTTTKTVADEAAGKHRKAKQLAKTEGVDLDILKIIKTRAKCLEEDNIAWLNKLLHMAKTFMVPGLEKVPFQEITAEQKDEEQLLKDRYELGLMHGRQGLEVEADLMDLATPAGQEYKKGYDRGCEDFKNLQPILMSKMDAPPTISKDDPAVQDGEGETGDTGGDEDEGFAEPKAAAKAPDPAPKKPKRGRAASAEKAARAAAKPAAPAEPPAKGKAKGGGKTSAKPPVETPGIMPSDDEEFAPRKDAVEKPAVPFLQ